MPRRRWHEDIIYKPNPRRIHLPTDEKVERRLSTERAKRAKADAAGEFSDAAMNEALARAEANARTSADSLVLAVIQEMRRVIEGRRRGAQQPRKLSEGVVRRIEAMLRAFSELSPKVQKHHRGRTATKRLLDALRAAGHRTDEDILAKDIAKVRPLIRLIQDGKLPPPGLPPPSERTPLEQEVGRQAVALAEARATIIGLIRRRFLGN